MVDLADSRKKIDEIDAQIVELFEKRMIVSSQVADYKISNNLPVFDKEREKVKIESVKSMTDDEFNKKCIGELYSQIMAMSRKLQYVMCESGAGSGTKLDPYKEIDELNIDNCKVIYQGIPGAYSETAMKQFFGEKVNCKNVPSFRDAMEYIAEGKADFAVLPIENSSSGMVNDTYDLLQEYNNYIVAETYVKVEHSLVGVKGTDLSKVERVYSHPQGLMQCAKFLDEHRNWIRLSAPNTAMSAKKIADDKDKKQVAIASESAARLYGLQVLKKGINTSDRNLTRFVIISSKRHFLKDASIVSICFETPNETGSLYNVLSHIIINGLNMTRIESRPIEDRNWEFRFFVDFEGNLRDAGVRNALRGIEEETNSLKLLGNYK